MLRVLDRSSVNLYAREPRPARAHLRLHHRHDREAQRHLHRHRPHRRGQDHHALRRAAPHQHDRLQAADRRGSGRVRHRRHHPDPDQRGDRPDLPARPARLPAPGSGPHHGRGNARPGDRHRSRIQASLTGHLVLSTLHTNDAAGAVTRLIDMGCEPFLVAASLEGVLAQRLVRTICKDCKTPYEPNEAILNQLGVSAARTRRQAVLHRRAAATSAARPATAAARASTSCSTSPIRSAS